MYDNERYECQISISNIGVEGQKRIACSSVLIIGAGGLGSPILFYLAAAGVGRIGIVENDTIEISNLNRQILYMEEDVDKEKVDVAANRIKNFNSYVNIVAHKTRLNRINAETLINNYDVIILAVDNIETRYLTHEVCSILKKPVVDGAVNNFDGLVYACKNGNIDLCKNIYPFEEFSLQYKQGVIGAVAGIIGSIMALEVLKFIISDYNPTNTVLLFDGLSGNFRKVKINI